MAKDELNYDGTKALDMFLKNNGFTVEGTTRVMAWVQRAGITA